MSNYKLQLINSNIHTYQLFQQVHLLSASENNIIYIDQADYFTFGLDFTSCGL